MKTVYIHADASGTYLGNGGFICLNELTVQLSRMGYIPQWFDHADRLRPEMWNWTGYHGALITSFDTVLHDDAPIITTWLYSWLDILGHTPSLWPRLRYWCSGELLRDEAIHEPARAVVREHLREIAINNPSLAYAYRALDIAPRWWWTNWIRPLFSPRVGRRNTGLVVGFQPDGQDDATMTALVEAFGSENVQICLGTQREVADLMRHCDLYLSWNNRWHFTCGEGESFGLNLYEAMASGCACVTRAHCGNTHLDGIVPRVETLGDAIRALREYQTDEVYRETARRKQMELIQRNYRFDDARIRHIIGYLEGK